MVPVKTGENGSLSDDGHIEEKSRRRKESDGLNSWQEQNRKNDKFAISVFRFVMTQCSLGPAPVPWGQPKTPGFSEA